MAKVIVRLKGAMQVSQEIKTDDEHMHTKVYLEMESDGKNHPDLSLDIKQPVGSEYHSTPLEVYLPDTYKGALSYGEFRNHIEAYYRKLVGPGGILNATGFMANNFFGVPYEFEFEADPKDFSW
jgi:hypothetical protein